MTLGLRAKALLLVGATMLASLAFEAYLSAQRRDAAIAEAMARVARIAARAAEEQAGTLGFAREVAWLTFELSDAGQMVRSRECPPSFERVVKNEPRIGNIVLIDAKGRVVCMAAGSPGVIDVADRPYFQHALAATDFVIDEAIVGRATGKWAIPLARAVRDGEGLPVAVLLVMLDLDWLSSEFAQAQLPMGARLGLIDSRGKVLARYPDPDRWIGRDASHTEFFKTISALAGTGTAESLGFDQVPRVYGFAKFADTNAGPIFLWAGIDKPSVTGAADREFYSGLAFAALVYGLAFLAIWYAGARLLRPLGVMADAAQRIGEGDFAVRSEVAYGKDEVGKLARSFDRMADGLETRTRLLQAANSELEAFAYSVSHDLRAPLRAIDGFSQALLEDYQGRLEPEGEVHLQRLRAAAQRMGQLIDDILRLSRVTRAEMKTADVDLSDLAGQIVSELRKDAPERSVEVSIAPGLRARGDAKLLAIVLENLLSNAWKFTSKRQHARIEVGSETREGETALYVRDNGAGFDMAYVANLFNAFQRLHQPGEFPGTGIGLATAKRVIARHGGRIWADARVGEGATFFFTLPKP